MDLLRQNPISRFLDDGGSWGDATAMDYELNLPIWEAQLKGSLGKVSPSAVAHRARLLKHMEEAYLYLLGEPERAHAKLVAFQREWEEQQKVKVKSTPTKKATSTRVVGNVANKTKNAWAALAESDEE